MFLVSIDTFAAICFTSSISFFENSLANVEDIHFWEIFCPDFDIIDSEQIKLNGDFKCYFDTLKFNPFITECQDINGDLYSCYYKDCKDEYDKVNEKRCQTLVLKCFKKYNNSYDILTFSNEKNNDRSYIQLMNVTTNKTTKNFDYNKKEPTESLISFISMKNISIIKTFDNIINYLIYSIEEIEYFIKLKNYIHSLLFPILFVSIIYTTIFFFHINVIMGEYFQNNINN